MKDATIDSTQSPQPTQEAPKPVRGKLISEAATMRRLEKRLVALVALDPDFISAFLECAGGLYFVFHPLLKQMQQHARRHRNSPRAFLKSVPRLIEKRCQIDLQYRCNHAHFLAVTNRLGEKIQDSNPANSPRMKLSKDQQRQKSALADLFEVSLPPRIPSEADGKKILELLTALGKAGRGRKLDEDSKKVIRLYENGMRGYGTLAKTAWPDLWEHAETSDDKRLLKDRARQIVRRSL